MSTAAALHHQLNMYDADAWRHTVNELAPHIPPIDRDATRIWFALCQDESDLEASHRFLYSHRFWPQVKSAIVRTTSEPTSLTDLVADLATAASRIARVDADRLLGMTAIGLKMLQVQGASGFEATAANVRLTDADQLLTATQVVARRRRLSQARTGLLRRRPQRWRVTLDESDPAAHVDVAAGSTLAPPTTTCADGACDHSWFGVLSGREHFSPITDAERGQLEVWGLLDDNSPHPIVRRACQARVVGRASVRMGQ